MSHLLKRTKKSCLKIFRKISSSKQMFPRKLDEDDGATANDAISTDALEYNNDLYVKWREDDDHNQTADANYFYSENGFVINDKKHEGFKNQSCEIHDNDNDYHHEYHNDDVDDDFVYNYYDNNYINDNFNDDNNNDDHVDVDGNDDDDDNVGNINDIIAKDFNQTNDHNNDKNHQNSGIGGNGDILPSSLTYQSNNETVQNIKKNNKNNNSNPNSSSTNNNNNNYNNSYNNKKPKSIHYNKFNNFHNKNTMSKNQKSNNNKNNGCMEISNRCSPRKIFQKYPQQQQEQQQPQQQQAQAQQQTNKGTWINGIQCNAKNEDRETSPNNTILQKLTAKLFLTAEGYDFHRLQQLRSDTASEVVQFENGCEATSDDQEAVYNKTGSGTEITEHEDVLGKASMSFEKVRYKEDVRYFRHTPSTSSLDNYKLDGGASMSTTPDFNADEYFEMDEMRRKPSTWLSLDSHIRNPFTNSLYQKHINSEPKPQNQHVQQQASPSLKPQQQRNSSQPCPIVEQPRHEVFLPKINMSLGSKLNGYQQNVVISQERNQYNNKLMPAVKWDINGNSLDADNVLEEENILFPNENWEEFDNRINKSIAAAKAANEQNANWFDDESPDSSLRSSSTTLETWIDDELLDNSFNEKLELNMNRCLIST